MSNLDEEDVEENLSDLSVILKVTVQILEEPESNEEDAINIQSWSSEYT